MRERAHSRAALTSSPLIPETSTTDHREPEHIMYESNKQHDRRANNEEPPAPTGWRRSTARRWPMVAAVIIILAFSFWLANRGDDVEEASVSEAVITDGRAATAASDSIIRLDSTGQRLAGIELADITPGTDGTLIANGTITYDADRVSVVSSRTEGRIVSVKADLGERVERGTVLALVESSEVGQTRGDLERARVAVDIARRNYEREQRLFAEQISSQKEMLEAEAAYRSAQAEYSAAEAKLRAFGATGGEGATFGLITPVSGTVVERNATPGQMVGPSANLFTVADIGRVWITVDVYEGDLRRVRKGAQAVVIPTALPSESFTGHVTYAGGVVDSATHTFKVRVELENSERRLRPGMFAQLRIQTPVAGDSASTMVVPEEAVQELGGKSVVFVAGSEPGSYLVRPVTVGARAGSGMLLIRDGLEAGDRIVVRGAFQLKAELTKASFGEEE
jgi:cobalt-zinc-cadmium efflux system membrane fusion protein